MSCESTIKSEGRILTVVHSFLEPFALAGARNVNGKILITPSSLRVIAKRPLIFGQLQVDDIVNFEARPMSTPDLHGAKFVALDGAVSLKKRAEEATVEGEGQILSLDLTKGCFGFAESSEVGNVFFSVSAVRPNTSDVNKSFKVGQRVRFKASINEGSTSTCKWRASIICPFGKASDIMPKQKLDLCRTRSNDDHCGGTVRKNSLDDHCGASMRKNSLVDDNQTRSSSQSLSIENSMNFMKNSTERLNSPKIDSFDRSIFSYDDHSRVINSACYNDYSDISRRIGQWAHVLNEFSAVEECDPCMKEQ